MLTHLSDQSTPLTVGEVVGLTWGLGPHDLSRGVRSHPFAMLVIQEEDRPFARIQGQWHEVSQAMLLAAMLSSFVVRLVLRTSADAFVWEWKVAYLSIMPVDMDCSRPTSSTEKTL